MTDTSVADAFFLEALTPEAREDPYDLYRRMRERGAVHSTTGMHLVFGHAAAWSVLRHPAASSDERRSTMFRQAARTDARLAAAFDQPPLMVFMDPPDHTRLRALVAREFTPRRVEALHPIISRLAAALIDDLRASGDGEVDLIERFAYPLPIAVICELLGIPISDRDRFREWSSMLAKSIDPGVLRTDADNEAIATADIELRTYATALLDDRRAHPGDDLISDLLRRHDASDGLTDRELADLVTLLLIAGHETTVNLIGNGVLALLDHGPINGSAGLVAAGIDELLRHDTPLQMVQRTATEALTIGECVVPAGDLVVVLLGAANRDPAVFPQPDRLDLHRSNAAHHLSFGGGIHHCLGATLARAEGAIAIEALLRAFPRLERSGPAPTRDTFNLRGRASLPVRIA